MGYALKSRWKIGYKLCRNQNSRKAILKTGGRFFKEIGNREKAGEKLGGKFHDSFRRKT